MPLKDEDGCVHRNLAVRGRPVALGVEFRIVRLIFLEHVVDCCQQHPGDGDDSFLVSPALLYGEVTVTDFWKFLGANSIESALNKQRLDLGSSSADSGGFLLPGALVVLRRKPSPGA